MGWFRQIYKHKSAQCVFLFILASLLPHPLNREVRNNHPLEVAKETFVLCNHHIMFVSHMLLFGFHICTSLIFHMNYDSLNDEWQGIVLQYLQINLKVQNHLTCTMCNQELCRKKYTLMENSFKTMRSSFIVNSKDVNWCIWSWTWCWTQNSPSNHINLLSVSIMLLMSKGSVQAKDDHLKSHDDS